MDPRLVIIRAWLWAITAIAMSVWSTEASLSVLITGGLGMFPGCSPCCSGYCGHCTSDFSNQYQVVIAGFTKPGGSTCACTDYNATYTLTRDNAHPVNHTVVTDYCIAYAAINPCICSASSDADHAADAKFAVNEIIFTVNNTSGTTQSAFVQFIVNTTGTDCHTLDQTPTSAGSWSVTGITSFLDCGALSSYDLSSGYDGGLGPGLGRPCSGTPTCLVTHL